MPICPECGATVPGGAIACGNCGATLSSQQPTLFKPFQSQASPSSSSQTPSSTPWTSRTYNSELPMRLEKALRKTEQLSYTAIALSVFIVILLLIILYG